MSTGRRRNEIRRGRRRRQMIRAFLMLALMLILVIGVVFAGILGWKSLQKRWNGGGRSRDTEAVSEQSFQTESETRKETETETETESEIPVSVNISAENLYSANALLIRAKNGEVLLDKAGTAQIYPASMTKIMTAVVVLEQIPDLQTRVRLSEAMFEQLYAEGASMAGFAPGDEVEALDLLYGVMLPSGAECCTGLADYIAGSEEAFAELMNEKAAELGMADTHFVNASGLHDPNHYTTAADLAKLLAYALENETFREIASSAVHSTGATGQNPDGITFYSTLFGNMTEEIRGSGLIRGGKTGWTDIAGLCLASYTEINGETFILITAGAQGNHETEQFHILDAYAVYQNIVF